MSGQGWPQFGDEVENTYASLSNPTRRGRFVRAGLATGRMNPGPWWELTDGHGEFWRCSPENLRPPVDDGYCGPLAEAPGAEPPPPMPDWAPPDGPWCLKQWIPFRVPHPKVDTCLLPSDHDGGCKGIYGAFLDHGVAMCVGRLKASTP